MRIFRNITLVIIVIFYAIAGINHFWHPKGYIKIIPAYIPHPSFMNILSGLCELIFSVMMIFPASRPLAGWLIIAMLTAFLPVHITMVYDAPMRLGKLEVTPFIAWARLLLQPVLMYWAWWSTRV
jgi:uncharacterized membrane protein